MDALRKAKQEGRKFAGVIEAEPNQPEFTKRFMASAKLYSGTPEAVPFLAFIFRVSNDKEVLGEAISILIRDHAKDARLADLAARLGTRRAKLGGPNTDKLMGGLLKSPHASVRAAVHFSKGIDALYFRKVTGKKKALAYSELRMAVKLAPKAKFAKKAVDILYAVDYLRVGKKVPDIQGEDTGGIAFKLSDYSGKVIMLDFWGDW